MTANLIAGCVCLWFSGAAAAATPFMRLSEDNKGWWWGLVHSAVAMTIAIWNLSV